jgi:hypothetical protein
MLRQRKYRAKTIAYGNAYFLCRLLRRFGFRGEKPLAPLLPPRLSTVSVETLMLDFAVETRQGKSEST